MIQKSMAMALALGLSTGALALATNPGFWPEAVFDEANPPAGWDLRDQEARALVSRVDFAYSGQHVFRFEQLDSGFGANKLEQCVELIPGEDFDFGIMVRSPVPSEQMAVRLNVEFYANQGDCQSRSDRNAQIGNDDFDHALDLPANAWRAYGSGVYSADSLLDAGAPGFARISFRLRDRSGEEGQPAERRRQVYLDAPWANGAVALANPSFDLVDYPEDIRFEQDSGLLGWDLRDVAGGAWLSQVDFARSNGTVFWFDQLERGFGDNKLEQCVALPTGTTESSVSVWVNTMTPDSNLRVRFASEFYASLDDCRNMSNMIGERFDTDVPLGAADEGEWLRIESDPVNLADDLPEPPSYLRLSIRARDRTDDGESAGSIIFFDDVETNLRNPMVSGPWFDPESQGQGFNLQQAPAGLFGYYYGYDQGRPLWLQLGLNNEPIVFGQTIELPVFAPAGGVFGAPEDVVPPRWGRMQLRIDSCSTAEAVLIGDELSQTFDLELLAPIDGYGVDNCTQFTGSEQPVALTAAWFEPATAGQGWNFIYTPFGLFGYFYGYDNEGDPLWLVTDLVDAELGQDRVFDLLRGQGGEFETPVPSEDLESWGSAEIRFDSCNEATVVLSGDDGEQVQSLIVLAPTVGLPGCD